MSNGFHVCPSCGGIRGVVVKCGCGEAEEVEEPPPQVFVVDGLTVHMHSDVNVPEDEFHAIAHPRLVAETRKRLERLCAVVAEDGDE